MTARSPDTDPDAGGPVAVVRRYLDAMEARDLEAAAACLAEGFVMVFPGGQAMTRLSELLDWAAPRYRFVRKRVDACDIAQGAGDSTVVYCFGTLFGAWPDGMAFAGIRFIDRFELVDGRILRQDVWNDIAEVKAQ